MKIYNIYENVSLAFSKDKRIVKSTTFLLGKLLAKLLHINLKLTISELAYYSSAELLYSFTFPHVFL